MRDPNRINVSNVVLLKIEFYRQFFVIALVDIMIKEFNRVVNVIGLVNNVMAKRTLVVLNAIQVEL